MIWALLAAHVVGLLVTGLAAPFLGRRVFYVAALAPLVTTVSPLFRFDTISWSFFCRLRAGQMMRK